MRIYSKDPSAVLDYKFDWANTRNGGDVSDWLAVGETIVSAIVTVDSGITKDSDSLTDTNSSVTVFLSGGTAGVSYTVACRITTNSTPARTDERSITISVVER